MEKTVEQGILYDFYGELLTERQRQIREDVILNGLPLSEIAREQGISRQGAHDLIKRCNKTLMGYGEKLQLVHKFNKTRQKVADIRQLTEQYQEAEDVSLLKRVEEIAGDVIEL